MSEQQTSASNNRPKCRDFAPSTFVGHWRDWHRGHGCHLDPTPVGEPTPPATPQPETPEPLALKYALALMQTQADVETPANRRRIKEHMDWLRRALSPPPDVERLTRVEVINENGRILTCVDLKSVELSYQDDGRTLKVFVSHNGRRRLSSTPGEPT